MRILQIGSDRSKRGILYIGTRASARQRAYGEVFGHFDIIGFSLQRDGATQYSMEPDTHVYPTNSLSRIFYGLDTIRIAYRLLRPEVISTQDPFEVGLLGVLLAWMFHVPLHVQVHTDFVTPAYAEHSTLNRLRLWCAGFVLSRASRIRVVSARIKKAIEMKYHMHAPISVLPIYVDIEGYSVARVALAMEERFGGFKTRVLVVSRLESEKNVALAISSFAKAPVDACLIIVGEGSEHVHLENLARSLDISSRVFFEGEKSAIEYYPLADLVLVTSHYEGYGLVIVEALASCKPVIATDVGIAREMGAIIADEQGFPRALREWFKNGPRVMQLKDYPYKNFDAYVTAYCDDICACKSA